jgi:hypothetical protein
MMRPQWTQFTKGIGTHQGLNPLGLEPLGASISRRLLPGVTNAAVHVRYFSFLSWVFWTFKSFHDERNGGKRTRTAQTRWRVRLENIHRAATLWYYPEGLTGLWGVEKAQRIGPSSSGSIDVTQDNAATPFQAAAYSASWANLGCGEVRSGVVALTPLGVQLAEGFDKELRSVRGGALALTAILNEKNRVPVDAIRTLAPAMALRDVPAGTDEHNALAEMLFRLDRADENTDVARNDRQRSRTLALLLELARQSRGTLSSASDLHAVFASGKFADSKDVNVPSPLSREFAWWQRYQERQWEKLGINAIWEEVIAALRPVGHEKSGRSLMQRLLYLAQRSRQLEEWCGSEVLDHSVGDAIQKAARKSARLVQNQVSPIESLVEDLREVKVSEERLGLALVVLLLTVDYWYRRRGEVPADYRVPHRSSDGPGRLPLDWVVDRTLEFKSRSVRDYLAWLFERCIIDQASRIAMQKMAAGQFRFFILRDSLGFRLVKDRGRNASLGFDSRRFPAAFQLMQGLRLVSRAETMTVTSHGRIVLKRVLERLAQDKGN